MSRWRIEVTEERSLRKCSRRDKGLGIFLADSTFSFEVLGFIIAHGLNTTFIVTAVLISKDPGFISGPTWLGRRAKRLIPSILCPTLSSIPTLYCLLVFRLSGTADGRLALRACPVRTEGGTGFISTGQVALERSQIPGRAARPRPRNNSVVLRDP